MSRKPVNPKLRKRYTGKKIPEFCINVQKKRLELGISQKDLANTLGIPRPRISELESGRFPEDPDRIIEIAKALNCSLDYLFGLSEEP